jgi:hypothetical protein
MYYLIHLNIYSFSHILLPNNICITDKSFLIILLCSIPQRDFEYLSTSLLFPFIMLKMFSFIFYPQLPWHIVSKEWNVLCLMFHGSKRDPSENVNTIVTYGEHFSRCLCCIHFSSGSIAKVHLQLHWGILEQNVIIFKVQNIMDYCT